MFAKNSLSGLTRAGKQNLIHGCQAKLRQRGVRVSRSSSLEVSEREIVGLGQSESRQSAVEFVDRVAAMSRRFCLVSCLAVRRSERSCPLRLETPGSGERLSLARPRRCSCDYRPNSCCSVRVQLVDQSRLVLIHRRLIFWLFWGQSLVPAVSIVRCGGK